MGVRVFGNHVPVAATAASGLAGRFVRGRIRVVMLRLGRVRGVFVGVGEAAGSASSTGGSIELARAQAMRSAWVKQQQCCQHSSAEAAATMGLTGIRPAGGFSAQGIERKTSGREEVGQNHRQSEGSAGETRNRLQAATK